MSGTCWCIPAACQCLDELHFRKINLCGVYRHTGRKGDRRTRPLVVLGGEEVSGG